MINQTNQKRYFANRTRKNPANPPTKANQKWLVPIEYDLNKDTCKTNLEALWHVKKEKDYVLVDMGH